jgi:hypothetical protein
MNHRILKKLCKKSVKYLENERGYKDCIFKTDKDGGECSTYKMDRKHMYRTRLRKEYIQSGEILLNTCDGRTVSLLHRNNTWSFTYCHGFVDSGDGWSDYYETDLWLVFKGWVYNGSIDMEKYMQNLGEEIPLKYRLNSTIDYFRAARKIMEERKNVSV